MEEIELLIALHENAKRQGQGSDEITELALSFTGLEKVQNIQVLDIGCGSGAQTLTLAKKIHGKITAIDLFHTFLDKLNELAVKSAVNNKIVTKLESMDKLQQPELFYDLIWSEGAIYNIGFKNGLEQWKKYLKKNAFVAVTEISWITKNRPFEIENYWNTEYSQIDTVANKIKIIENIGYRHVAAFMLPEYCWMDNYYTPMKNRFKDFLNKYNNETARQIVKNEETEIALYEKYKEYYSYVFYIMQKI